MVGDDAEKLMVSVAMKLRRINSITTAATTQGISEKQATPTTAISEEAPTTTAPGISESQSPVISEKLIKSCLHGLTKRYGCNRSRRSDVDGGGSELLSFVALEASVDDITDLKNTSAGTLFC